MKKTVRPTSKIVASNLIDYSVNVNFASFVGADNTYEVSAESEEDALDAAIEEAKADLEVTDIYESDEGEWTVTVGFDGMVGVEQEYVVYADDEDEAADAAIEEASGDLSSEIEV